MKPDHMFQFHSLDHDGGVQGGLDRNAKRINGGYWIAFRFSKK